ncbi:MAG: ATP-binding protein [Capsulimonadaceae bacterium]
MTVNLELQHLRVRESEQTEWKENVADVNDVAKTLAAFANDLANLGGGYVVCGAREAKDEHGFPTVFKTGLTATRLKEVENHVLAICRDRVSPPITPLVEELPSETDDRRILVFIQPATSFAHTFRGGDVGSKHFVRVSRETIEAKNGVLRDLLVRKGALEPWDRRPCSGATVNDLDLLALRDTLQRIGLFSSDVGIEHYLAESYQLSAFVPSLCVREPLTNTLRPRNFAILLFGRQTQRFIPGAFSIFSIYPGTDRSDTYAERHDIAGGLIDQARRLTELLDVQSYMAFDKNDLGSPNAMKYPRRALNEATVNALAHRDYELDDPTRVTVFADRIEVYSPGTLPLGVDPEAFKTGRASPKWRNQALAWFFRGLQLAQGEGQGIPTILRVMREEGCPPPTLDADVARVLCILPAHPRHGLLRDLREVEQAIALGQFTNGKTIVRSVLDRDPLNYRAVQLFAEIQQALQDPEPVFAFMSEHGDRVLSLPFAVLLQLNDALMTSSDPPRAYFEKSRQLLASATRGRLAEREVRRLAVALIRTGQEQEALSLLERELAEHPEWQRNASLLQMRGDALINLAKRCRTTAKRRDVPRPTKDRAWNEFYAYLTHAEHDLQQALEFVADDQLKSLIQRNLVFLQQLRQAGPRLV